MTENKNETPEQEPPKSSKSSYTMTDVFHVTDDLFQLSKDKEYPLGVFVYGLILTLELSQKLYDIPSQKIADAKRDCQKYADEFMRIKSEQKTPIE